MRKAFKFLLTPLFILLMSANLFAYSDDGSVAQKWSNPNPNDPFKVFLLVRYPSTSANEPGISRGDVVVWDCVSDDGVTVNLTGDGGAVGPGKGYIGTAMSGDAVAGVIVTSLIPSADQANAAGGDINRRNWGWMQTYGINTTTNITSGSAVVGAQLIASNAAPRYATTASTIYVGTGNPPRSMGFSVDASSQGQAEAFIDTI